jgi:DNA/RNA-binding domain of Phe-tRNA-synthetase-like protein
MSQIEVNKINPATGNVLTAGDSGDVVAIYNTVDDNVTTTTDTAKNMFLIGVITVADTKTWTIAGSGAMRIL